MIIIMSVNIKMSKNGSDGEDYCHLISIGICFTTGLIAIRRFEGINYNILYFIKQCNIYRLVCLKNSKSVIIRLS